MTDIDSASPGSGEFGTLMSGLALRANELQSSANQFARAMTTAFSRGIIDGRRFDDVLRGLALRLSDLAVRMAFRPLTSGIASGIESLFGSLGGGGGGTLLAALGGAQKFASGGIIGGPTFFALGENRLGLAGEAGPEAVLPLVRGPDGALGVNARGGAAARVTVNIATPDADSFRRSETYLTGIVARAVARGQRGM